MVKKRFHIGWLYEISDKAPVKEKDKVLQLQNEPKDFVIYDKENDKVSILVSK